MRAAQTGTAVASRPAGFASRATFERVWLPPSGGAHRFRVWNISLVLSAGIYRRSGLSARRRRRRCRHRRCRRRLQLDFGYYFQFYCGLLLALCISLLIPAIWTVLYMA